MYNNIRIIMIRNIILFIPVWFIIHQWDRAILTPNYPGSLHFPTLPGLRVGAGSSSCHQTCVFHLSAHFFTISLKPLRSSKEQDRAGVLHHVCGMFCSQTTLTCDVSFEVPPFLSLFFAACEFGT